MAKEPIVSTLFRFITTRNPQLLCEEERKRGFIFFPSNERINSFFLKNLDDNADKDVRRTFLETRTAIYSYLTTRATVKAVKPELYNFSCWLMKSKSTVSVEEIAARTVAPATLTLTTTQLISLWDNLYYQVLTKKSDVVREAIIQMIIADNFLKMDDSATTGTGKLINNDIQIQRLANAFVVISDRLISNSPSIDNATKRANQKDYKYLENQLDAYVLESRIEDYNKAITEIKSAVNQNRTENTKAYDTVYETYSNDLVTAFENATEIVDPTTKEVTYENLVLPKFNFTSTDIDEDGYLDSKVSATSLEIIKTSFSNGHNSEETLLSSVEKELKKLNQDYYSKIKSNNKTALYKGALITTRDHNLPAYSFSVSALSKINDSGLLGINLSLVTGHKNVNMDSASFDITFSDNSVVNGVSSIYTNNSSDTILLSTSPTILKIPIGVTSFTLTGVITLENDEVLDITSKSIIIDGKKANGIATNKKLAKPPTKIEHHGIKKVGVADFRRVEQEVCCYVPGEVSRIENILAREYKERSTRSLLSTENTTEDTTETEIENLTDTTTSERNELTSEVSSIINEDKSQDYGASAGVEGRLGTVNFYANGFFNGASSSSSSNSNTTSQTYAEEVTTRALERVVQKVTKKRTSRILREFEENNKHGFDNRGGDSHVTGIYRWVDKIYTNKLINYGKRLMYEFNVPEPARFYKDSIIQIIEGEAGEVQSNIPGGLILPNIPQHPSVYLPNGPEDLDVGNHHWISAKYNAKVDATPETYEYVGASVTKSEQQGDGGDGTNKAVSTVAKVPDGYKAIAVKTTGQTHTTHGREVRIMVGARNMPVNSSSFFSIEPSLEEVPISAFFEWTWIASINIVVKCQITLEAYQQWQNETYEAILTAYNDRIDEYNNALYATFVPELSTPEDESRLLEFNPLLNRSLEKRELKRAAIDIMAKPFGAVTARHNYVGDSTTDINLSSSLDRHASYVKFFEQAFDWEIMAYIFYPYFYGRKSDWKNLFLQSNGTDPIFQAFLQSGMSRMVVPVRPGFEKAVTYFLETGDLWIGDQLAIDRDDDLYLSIAEETQSVEGKVEKEWETRVPTALTILQADSAPLNDNGLPCCHNELETDNLAFGTSVMVAKPDTTTP